MAPAPDDRDLRLLQDCLEGEGKPGAWEAFVARFTPYLAEVCRRALRRYKRPHSEEDVDDTLQEVFAHLLDREMHALRAYRGEASVAGYLGILAVYRVLKAPLPPGAQEPLPDRPDPAAGPLEILEARELEALLSREIARLSDEARLAITLRRDGLSVREIGEVLGISEDAAAQVLSRARALLRERLADRPGNNPK